MTGCKLELCLQSLITGSNNEVLLDSTIAGSRLQYVPVTTISYHHAANNISCVRKSKIYAVIILGVSWYVIAIPLQASALHHFLLNSSGSHYTISGGAMTSIQFEV